MTPTVKLLGYYLHEQRVPESLAVEILRAAAQAVAEERERCAKLAEEHRDISADPYNERQAVAAAIRSGE